MSNADKKLSKKDLDIADFLEKSANGLTVVECAKIFHTTELRSIVARLRAHGYPIEDKREKSPNAVPGTQPHKRYYMRRE